ncbi:hypothetical protein A0J61_07220 [Choanephora cucurbitarum]|uniref:Uncharacterized protein n=1 Tax=Choanephora cucurbitarum TaxID=101091 RepID=A0A1C7N6Q5_9FUNG|nr:hypothetical protein A0J61_07220 [Choanephora cucurbitarum]
MNNNNSNAKNNSRPKKYKDWTNDGCIDVETNERGLSSAELLFDGSKHQRTLSPGKYFEENGIHHCTKHQISTRVSQRKARYTNACQWLAQTGQGIRDQIFVMDDAVENEKVQDNTIQDHIKKICHEFNRMNNIWGTSVSMNLPCESSDSDNVEKVMTRQELMEPVEKELSIADKMATQSEERATALELLAQLLDQQNERAQKRINVDEELLTTEKSMASSMQKIANAIKAMVDNDIARTKLSRLKDQR